MILSNGGYAVMDRLVEQTGRHRAVARVRRRRRPGWHARSAVPLARITEHGDLTTTLDDVVGGLATRDEPLLLAVEVAPDGSFAP